MLTFGGVGIDGSVDGQSVPVSNGAVAATVNVGASAKCFTVNATDAAGGTGTRSIVITP